MWSKPLLCRFRQPGEIQKMQALQGFAAFHLVLSRIPPRHSQTRRDTNFAIPGYSVFAIIPRRKRKSKITHPTMFYPKKQQEHTVFLRALLRTLFGSPASLRPGEGDVGAEQVAVNGQMECAAHQMHQTAGDRQAQAAALGVAGGVAPDEAFHQLVR